MNLKLIHVLHTHAVQKVSLLVYGCLLCRCMASSIYLVSVNERQCHQVQQLYILEWNTIDWHNFIIHRHVLFVKCAPEGNFPLLTVRRTSTNTEPLHSMEDLVDSVWMGVLDSHITLSCDMYTRLTILNSVYMCQVPTTPLGHLSSLTLSGIFNYRYRAYIYRSGGIGARV